MMSLLPFATSLPVCSTREEIGNETARPLSRDVRALVRRASGALRNAEQALARLREASAKRDELLNATTREIARHIEERLWRNLLGRYGAAAGANEWRRCPHRVEVSADRR